MSTCSMTLGIALKPFQKSSAYSISNPKIFYRYLRGSRYGKNLNSEELKYRRILKAFQANSKQCSENLTSNAVEENLAEVIPTKSFVSESLNQSNSNLIKSNAENLILRLEEKVTPLKAISYEKQLLIKYKKSLRFLRSLGHTLESLKLQIALGPDKLPCPLETTLSSPVTEAYRNKDEFSIGRSIDGDEKTVGFYVQKSTDSSESVCVSPDELIIIKESHKKFVKHFQNYIRQSSLPACVQFDNKGYWKNVLIRSNSEGDLMGIIVMHPQALSETELNDEKQKLREYFASVYESSHELKSLYFQACAHSKCTHEQSPFQLLLGEPTIVEKSNGMKFHISPDSFFHANTTAAESMYNSILKLCRKKASATVLDVCCGTGSSSLAFSPHVKRCIGIDNSIHAISDAKQNAEINSVHNAEFIYGQPDLVLKSVFVDNFYDDLIAVLNPSMTGINKHTITSLRECKHLNKIIYIMSKPKPAFENLVNLCKPTGVHRHLGKPFLPILAVPVDLFPQTEHYGLVIMFQRL